MSAASEPQAIRILPESQAKLLTTGQLVIDVTSIVRELVENALDAGATQVKVTVAAQADSIEVADNGVGIPAPDRLLIGSAHATSKISAFEDIFSSSSHFGFRGEALFSVGKTGCELERVGLCNVVPSSASRP